MSIITITPNLATGSHQLEVTSLAQVNRIQRTDANGTRDVRLVEGILPWPGSGSTTLVVDDYEAAHGTSTYTVTSTADVSTADAVLDLSGVVWLGVPVTPQFSAKVQAVLGYGADGESRATVLEPEGSSFPIVIRRGSGSRTGQLELWGGSYTEALNIWKTRMRGQVLFMRQSEHPGMDMFFHASNASITTLTTEQGTTRFGVQLRYLEVARPGAPLSGALGWTWLELKNTYATWGDVFNDFGTWGDVRTNTP